MVLRSTGTALAVLGLAATALLTGSAHARPDSTGAPGAGDPYFPCYGNGGYNVRHNRDFLRVLRTWVRTRGDGNGSIHGFHRLAERVSGRQLDHLFKVWLYSDHRPRPSKANGFPAQMLQR